MLTKFLSSLLLALAVLSSSSQVFAVKAISGSNQKHYSNAKVDNHWVILGAIERIKGQVKPENELYLSGKITRWLWQLPGGYNSEQAFTQMRQQLGEKVVDLYSCEGRQCGLSNDFANKVFKRSILSGRDSDQLYWAGLDNGRKKTLWVLYSGQRSSKGVHLYLERLKVNKSVVPELQRFVQMGELQKFFERHYMTIQRLDSNPATLGAEQLELIKGVLQDYPNKKFALVVHRYGKLEKQRLQEQTESEAQALVDQLAKADGFIKNLYAHGAGSMMPREEVFDRIELVELVE